MYAREDFRSARGGPPLRVLLVDDSWAFLGSAEHFLSMEAGLQIVGCASSGQEAIEQVALLKPDLVLMDVAMPKMNGLAAARRIKALGPRPRLVLLTVHDHPAYRAEAEAAGADGFLGKSDFGTQLVPLIHRLFGHSAEERIRSIDSSSRIPRKPHADPRTAAEAHLVPHCD
jgi:DNA-binding NarL/FixJ family response regulator